MARSVRDDFTTLKALLPIAQHVIEAAGAAERILNMAASGDNLAARKEQLAKEVATTLKELEEVKRRRDQAVAEHEAAWAKHDEEQTAYAAHLNQMTADHAADLSKAEQASAAKMAEALRRHTAEMEATAREHADIKKDVAGLVSRRNGLKNEIDQLVAKFR